MTQIGAGFFNGLGAVGEAEIGHFDPAANDYTWIKLSGPYEIVSLYGNITKVDGKPFIHAHIALGDKTFAVRGGHLKEAVVSVTCEVTLTRFRDDIGRTKDEATGLFRLALEPAKTERRRRVGGPPAQPGKAEDVEAGTIAGGHQRGLTLRPSSTTTLPFLITVRTGLRPAS